MPSFPRFPDRNDRMDPLEMNLCAEEEIDFESIPIISQTTNELGSFHANTPMESTRSKSTYSNASPYSSKANRFSTPSQSNSYGGVYGSSVTTSSFHGGFSTNYGGIHRNNTYSVQTSKEHESLFGKAKKGKELEDFFFGSSRRVSFLVLSVFLSFLLLSSFRHVIARGNGLLPKNIREDFLTNIRHVLGSDRTTVEVDAKTQHLGVPGTNPYGVAAEKGLRKGAAAPFHPDYPKIPVQGNGIVHIEVDANGAAANVPRVLNDYEYTPTGGLVPLDGPSPQQQQSRPAGQPIAGAVPLPRKLEGQPTIHPAPQVLPEGKVAPIPAAVVAQPKAAAVVPQLKAAPVIVNGVVQQPAKPGVVQASAQAPAPAGVTAATLIDSKNKLAKEANNANKKHGVGHLPFQDIFYSDVMGALNPLESMMGMQGMQGGGPVIVETEGDFSNGGATITFVQNEGLVPMGSPEGAEPMGVGPLEVIEHLMEAAAEAEGLPSNKGAGKGAAPQRATPQAATAAAAPAGAGASGTHAVAGQAHPAIPGQAPAAAPQQKVVAGQPPMDDAPTIAPQQHVVAGQTPAAAAKDVPAVAGEGAPVVAGKRIAASLAGKETNGQPVAAPAGAAPGASLPAAGAPHAHHNPLVDLIGFGGPIEILSGPVGDAVTVVPEDDVFVKAMNFDSY